MQNTDDDDKQVEQDLEASLGTIYGVSELRQSSMNQFVGAPVLLAERVLVFFAWQEGDM